MEVRGKGNSSWVGKLSSDTSETRDTVTRYACHLSPGSQKHGDWMLDYRLGKLVSYLIRIVSIMMSSEAGPPEMISTRMIDLLGKSGGSLQRQG